MYKERILKVTTNVRFISKNISIEYSTIMVHSISVFVNSSPCCYIGQGHKTPQVTFCWHILIRYLLPSCASLVLKGLVHVAMWQLQEKVVKEHTDKQNSGKILMYSDIFLHQYKAVNIFYFTHDIIIYQMKMTHRAWVLLLYLDAINDYNTC